MIAAVLVDAGRRFWKERRAEIRLNARIDRSRAGSDDDNTFNLLTELPNGGARIVRRDDLDAGGLDGANHEPTAIGDASASSTDPAQEERESVTEARRFPAAPDPIDLAVESEEVEAVASKVEASVPNEAVSAGSASAPRRRTVKPLGDPSTESSRDASAEGTVDWLDKLEPEEVSETDSVEQGRLPRGANTHVFILYVVARSEDGFSGMDILESLLACDLRFGDMDFFHRHERASGRGPIEFSVANMMKPGVFDIDNMEPLQTRGLMFFVTLPGPTDMLKAFDYMYETAKVVAKGLDGDIQDEKRSVVTRQSLEHMRQQIRELERRLLVRRS